MTDAALRMDVLLNRLCLARSRSEAKQACDAGAVLLDGVPAKASSAARAGQRLRVDYPNRLLEVELLEMPRKSVSKKAARDLYRVLRDEPREPH